MVLATHAVVGTLVATAVTQNPVLAFVIAFASHFALDSIPHWDYKLLSLKKDEEHNFNHEMVLGKMFILDLCRVGTDAIIGVGISIIVTVLVIKNTTPLVVAASIVGAILPDPLQVVYWKTRSKFLFPLQKFHKWIHGRSLKISTLHGVLLQILVVSFFLVLVVLLKNW